MKKVLLKIIALNIFCIFPIIIDWFQWDVLTKITIIYNSFIAGIFYYAFIVARVIILIYTFAVIMYNIKKFYKHSFIKTFYCISLVLYTLTFVIQFAFPHTTMYNNIEYKINNNYRREIVNMFISNDKCFSQINVSSYKLPVKFIFASHNGRIMKEISDGNLKILFYSHKGIFGNSVVIYDYGQQGVHNGDFGLIYKQIKFVAPNWYIAKF